MDKSSETKGVSRRHFLKTTGISGSGLFLGMLLPGASGAAGIISTFGAEVTDVEFSAWISINTLGKVTIVNHRAEMGQGSYQSVPQIVAEELEVDLDDVNVVSAQGNQKYGNQITGGSSTIRGSYKNLLKLGATAREMLLTVAAGRWNVSGTECYAESGHIIHRPSGRKFHYGELAVEASKLEAPKEVQLKKIADYKKIRKPLHRMDTPAKINGTAEFGLDKKIPGMMHAQVERNPRMRGKVKSFDDSQTRKIPGVKHVFVVKMMVFSTLREGVVVVADTRWAAMQGRKALKVEWDDTGFEHLNSAEIFKRQEELVKTKEGVSTKTQGDPNGVIAQSAQTLDVIYQTPYQAHYAMEPLNCMAHYQADKIEIWGPIQAPDWIQTFISEQFKMPKEKVIVNMTFLGGGFGRKAFTDYPHEAVMISKEIGAPVQVMWTREDDATQGPYRPGNTYRCQAAIEKGEVSALKFRMAGQNLTHWMTGNNSQTNNSMSEGFLAPYYKNIKNISFNDILFETPIPILWWRSVYASTNGFAYECFLDEVAIATKEDPLAFRRKYLKEKRELKLIDKLEEVSGWKNRKKNEGFGVAITECFASTAGHIVKVSKKPGGGIRIDKVWVVMDCGWYVNPDIIKAQVEGSVIMALGAATMHEILFEDGLTVQKNFYEYAIPRIGDTPPIEVYIMENEENAGGVGEPGLPAFAPALANAIFDLTGTRIRKMPFNMESI
jgi:isoquinoline 1-oxidoreductase beta subunit